VWRQIRSLIVACAATWSGRAATASRSSEHDRRACPTSSPPTWASGPGSPAAQPGLWTDPLGPSSDPPRSVNYPNEMMSDTKIIRYRYSGANRALRCMTMPLVSRSEALEIIGGRRSLARIANHCSSGQDSLCRAL
jgi:hypothetical protein